MKRNFVTLTLLICLFVSTDSIFASEKVYSKITKVTVYLQNAKITRTAYVKVPAGPSEIIFENLSSKVIKNSLQVSINEDVKLLSATYGINYLKDKGRSKEIKLLQDSLELVNYDIAWIKDQKYIFGEEEKVILVNNKLGSEQKGFTVAELRALSDFYRKRLGEIRLKVLELNKKGEKLRETQQRLLLQLNQLKVRKFNPTGEVVMNITSSGSKTVKVVCSYLVTDAGWIPLYDLRSGGTDKPVVLTYKANIYQNSGYDWSKVKLTVSTANPSVDNSRPVLYPWYIDFYYPSYKKMGYQQSDKVQAMQNIATIDMKREASEEMAEESIYEYETVNENQLSVEFAIEDEHNIPSDGKEHLVSLDDISLKVEYEYHTVPKLDKGAFLLAKVSDWGKLNLIPGNANIFFEDTYVGQSYINPYTTADTLLLSMGRDERIKVKRIKVQEMTSSKVIGPNKKEVIAYEISIRNTKSEAISIEVLDQLPISKNKDIEVKTIDLEGADYIEKYGRLLWRLEIKPNETKKVNFVYIIKYPKDKVVTGL